MGKLSTPTPPAKFSPAGSVYWAQFFPGTPSHAKNIRAKGARAEGIRYEKKALEYLKKQVEKRKDEYELILSPWLVFRSGQNPKDRFAQPDALLYHQESKTITIVEVKLQHTAAAWWQVRQLYEPILRHIYPGFRFEALEIVRWLDPRTPFPETFFYAENVFETESGKFGVHIYDPRINK